MHCTSQLPKNVSILVNNKGFPARSHRVSSGPGVQPDTANKTMTNPTSARTFPDLSPDFAFLSQFIHFITFSAWTRLRIQIKPIIPFYNLLHMSILTRTGNNNTSLPTHAECSLVWCPYTTLVYCRCMPRNSAALLPTANEFVVVFLSISRWMSWQFIPTGHNRRLLEVYQSTIISSHLTPFNLSIRTTSPKFIPKAVNMYNMDSCEFLQMAALTAAAPSICHST